jgi:hypothetical protein
MIRTFLACAAVALAASAQAAPVLDTGAPDGLAVGALALDGVDWYAARFDLASASGVDAVSAHVLGGAAGETFHLSLYADDGAGEPGLELDTASATFGADGWNGVSGLSGWTLDAGSYWIGVEVADGDTLGSASATGALLDQGAPAPADTAYSSFGAAGYSAFGGLSFGLRVDAVSAVPEAGPAALMLAGLALVAGVARRRRAA